MNNRDERRKKTFSHSLPTFYVLSSSSSIFPPFHPRSEEKKQQISTVCKKVVVAVKRRMSGRNLCAIDKSSLFNHAAAALGRGRKPRIHPEWYVEMLKIQTRTCNASKDFYALCCCELGRSLSREVWGNLCSWRSLGNCAETRDWCRWLWGNLNHESFRFMKPLSTFTRLVMVVGVVVGVEGDEGVEGSLWKSLL